MKRGLPGLHNFLLMCWSREDFCLAPRVPMGQVSVMKFAIYAPLTPKMHHINLLWVCSWSAFKFHLMH